MHYRSFCLKSCVLAGMLLATASSVQAAGKVDSLVAAGKYAEAIAFAEKDLPAQGRTVDDWLALARAYDKMSAPGERIDACLKGAQKVSPSEPRVFLAFGIYAYKAKKYDDALRHFQKSYILEHSATSAEGIARAAANLNNWDVARDAAESAVNLDPNVYESRAILAKLYLQENNYKGAVDQLLFITKKEPNNVENWKKLAVCYEKTNQPDELAKVDPKIIELDKKDLTSRQRYAKYALARRDTATAFELYKDLAVLMPNDAVVFRGLYEIARGRANKKEAILYLKNYLMLDSSSAASYRDLGDMLYEQKDMDGAADAYRKALRLDAGLKGVYKNYVEIVISKNIERDMIPAITGAIRAGEADARAYIALGNVYRKDKKYPEAIKAYQDGLKTDASNIAVLSALGECQAASGDAKGAITTYEQVVMMNSKATTEFKLLGDLYSVQKRTDNAMKAYKEYIVKVSGDEGVAKTIGLHEYGKQAYKEAIKYLEMVKDGNNQDVDYLAALGTCYYQLQDYKKAADLFTRVQAKRPSATVQKNTLKLQAECFEKTGDEGKAADAYAAYTKVPGVSDADASYKKAFLQEKGNKAGAIKDYQANTAAFPKDARNFLRLGLIYAEDKKTHPQAADMLKKATALVDTIPEVWQTLGEVHNKLGNKDSELEAYKKLLTFKPQDLTANKRVGMVLIEKKQLAAGISNLEMALTMAPNDVEIIMVLADAYMSTKRPAQAVELLEKAKAIKKDDVKLRLQLYALDKETNQARKAENEIQEVIALTKDNKYRLVYSNDLIEAKRYEDAAKILKDIVAADPENVDCLMLLGQVQRAQKKFGEAIETFKTVLFIKGPYAPAHYERGNVYLDQNDLANAKAYYDRAVAANDKYALGYFGLALVAKFENKTADYQKNLAKAKSLDPTNKAILAESGGK